MDAMKPMEPMEPMKPMTPVEPWWPADLGEPSSTGSQNDVKYAFFADKHRLVVRQNGATTNYDSGDHHIDGVSQQQGSSSSLTFSSDTGPVDLSTLKRL